MKHAISMGLGKSSLNRQHRREVVTAWMMAGPAIILIFTFLVLPFLMGFGLSFTNQRLISPNPTEFIGFRNYSNLIRFGTLVLEPEGVNENGELIYPRLRDYTRHNPEYPKLNGMRELHSWRSGDSRVYLLSSDVVFVRAVVNTFQFVAVIVPVQGGLALLLALLLNRRLPLIDLFRTLYFMPVIVSMVVVALLWRFIYDAENGLLNTILGYLTFGRFQPIDWIGRPDTALPSIMAMSVWQAVGFHMVIWLAGLQAIPAIRYEAARIDGAGPWQQFRYVTWPGLYNTAVFIFLVITMQAFALFTQISVMTNGGPLDSTQSIVFQVVDRGFWKQDIGGGAAMSVIFFLIVLTISMIQRYLLREKPS